ncbi:hypothetical protein OHB07_37565 [Streptomyces sp. NBC_00111]|uniref:hypothetical protein n=1 Tax=Streptomyces sp. NBC_00111 TaxID=2975655 RepID=UPI003245407B
MLAKLRTDDSGGRASGVAAHLGEKVEATTPEVGVPRPTLWTAPGRASPEQFDSFSGIRSPAPAGVGQLPHDSVPASHQLNVGPPYPMAPG